jgi:hypothetical protein
MLSLSDRARRRTWHIPGSNHCPGCGRRHPEASSASLATRVMRQANSAPHADTPEQTSPSRGPSWTTAYLLYSRPACVMTSDRRSMTLRNTNWDGQIRGCGRTGSTDHSIPDGISQGCPCCAGAVGQLALGQASISATTSHDERRQERIPGVCCAHFGGVRTRRRPRLGQSVMPR